MNTKGTILHLPLAEPAAKYEARTAQIDHFYDWIYRRGLRRMQARAQVEQAATEQRKDRAA
jgi:hypothetical protein